MTDRLQMFIDGEWCDSSDGRTLTTADPATGRDWATFPSATAAAWP